MKYLSILAALSMFMIFACTADDSDLEIPIAVQYIGTYEIEGTHRSGIHTEYDSLGYIAFQGYDTTNVMNDMFTINFGSTKDTLIIDNLINSLFDNTIEVKAVITEDTIRIVHDFSDQLRRDYIRGNIWLAGDSLFLDYTWDNSEIWSGYAPPERGTVKAKGVMMN